MPGPKTGVQTLAAEREVVVEVFASEPGVPEAETSSEPMRRAPKTCTRVPRKVGAGEGDRLPTDIRRRSRESYRSPGPFRIMGLFPPQLQADLASVHHSGPRNSDEESSAGAYGREGRSTRSGEKSASLADRSVRRMRKARRQHPSCFDAGGPRLASCARDLASRAMNAEPNDEALVTRVAQGDVAAFAALYDRYAHRIHAWAAHMVGTAEAEELVQDSFLRLWDKAAQFDARRGRFASWFMAIARHRLMGHLRQRSAQQRIVAADEIERVVADAVAPGRAVDEEAWSRETAAVVLRALGELPPEQRRVLVLAYFAGLTQSAIAKLTGAPLGTVKKRTRLALQKLRERLSDALGSGWTETG